MRGRKVEAEEEERGGREVPFGLLKIVCTKFILILQIKTFQEINFK